MTTRRNVLFACSVTAAALLGAGVAWALAVPPSIARIAIPSHTVITPKTVNFGPPSGSKVSLTCPASAPAIPNVSSDGNWSFFVENAALIYAGISQGELMCSYGVQGTPPPLNADGSPAGASFYLQGINPNYTNCTSSSYTGPITCTVK